MKNLSLNKTLGRDIDLNLLGEVEELFMKNWYPNLDSQGRDVYDRAVSANIDGVFDMWSSSLKEELPTEDVRNSLRSLMNSVMDVNSINEEEYNSTLDMAVDLVQKISGRYRGEDVSGEVSQGISEDDFLDRVVIVPSQANNYEILAIIPDPERKGDGDDADNDEYNKHIFM